MNHEAIEHEALSRAVKGQKLTNYPAIIDGFAAKGIALEAIKPRENIFTFHAWKALGRSVRKGEHGVKITTVIDCDKTLGDGLRVPVKKAKNVTVFHISQTDPVN